MFINEKYFIMSKAEKENLIKDGKNPEKDFTDYKYDTMFNSICISKFDRSYQAQLIGELMDIRQKFFLFNNFRMFKTRMLQTEVESEFDRLLIKLDKALNAVLKACDVQS